MGIEAGMTMENFNIVLLAYWKMFTYFWPVILFGIIGMLWADKKVECLKERKQ